jgi:hypothetical protein
VAIDRTSKFAFARLVESAGKIEAAQFLRDLIEAVPYRIHTVLTDNGVQFTPASRTSGTARSSSIGCANSTTSSTGSPR